MRLRSLVLSLIVLAAVTGDCALLDSNKAYADARVVIGQPSSAKRSIELNIRGSAHYGYGWYDNFYRGYGRYYGDYAVGPGIQLLFPVVQNGFIPSINNAFYVGFFSDLTLISDYYNGYLFGVTIGPMVQWRFVILEMFQGGSLSTFANLGFGIWPWFIPENRYIGISGGVHWYGFPLFELGANLFFTKLFGLTLSFGYPAVKFGVTLAF